MLLFLHFFIRLIIIINVKDSHFDSYEKKFLYIQKYLIRTFMVNLVKECQL